MTITSKGDIRLNGLDYLLSRGGYHVGESSASEPRTGGATEPQFEHTDNWTYWGAEKWLGMNWPDWEAGGPFMDGYGLNLTLSGQIKIAKQLAVTKADVTDPLGYVCIPLGHKWIVFIGKSSGTMFSSSNAGATWTTNTDALGIGIKPRGVYGIYKNDYYVGSTFGKLAKANFNDDGTGAVTFTDMGGTSGGPSPNDTYILGSYKGLLWVGGINQIFTFDGTVWEEFQAGNVDGTPIAGAVGNNVLYIITSGPQARLLVTDGAQLLQMAVLGSDFTPTAMVFLETLIIFGKSTDDVATHGEVWRIEQGGIKPFFDYGTDVTNDWGIRSAIVDRGAVIWGANRKTGLGVYDPDLDIFDDVPMGFYVGSTIDTEVGAVHGILQSEGVLYCGIEGKGIYKQTTPGTYRLTSSLFGGNTKHINKIWGFAEIYHSALAAGQTIGVRAMKDGVTVDAWGTSNTVGATSKIVPATANYKNPYIQYDLAGTANGADLTIFDLAIAFIEVSDNPKKEWDLTIALEGSSVWKQVYRDGTDNARTAITMLAELNALWNVKTVFDDLDGTPYNVIVKAPRAREVTSGSIRYGEIVKTVKAGVVDELSISYSLHLTQL